MDDERDEVPPEVLAGLRMAAEAEGLVDVAWTTTDSPIGPLLLAATDAGLVMVSFHEVEAALDELARKLSPRVLHAPGRLDEPRRQLDEYFAGDRRRFELPLDRSLSHGFRRRVLEELVEVGYGEVTSYQELAARVGHPRASRAVGTAMATNPIPIVQPCHRVLRSGGALGGYGGGVDVKRRLLRLEGVPVG